MDIAVGHLWEQDLSNGVETGLAKDMQWWDHLTAGHSVFLGASRVADRPFDYASRSFNFDL